MARYLSGFVTGKSFDEKVDLAGVVGDVLADVEPLAVVVGRSPGPGFVDGHEPGVVSLAKLGEGLFSGFVESVGVEGEVVAFDGLAASVAEVHGGVPFGGDVGGPLAPWLPVEGVALVVGFGGGEVEHEGSDGVRVLI